MGVVERGDGLRVLLRVVIRVVATRVALAVNGRSSVTHRSLIGQARLCDNLKNYD
jgi:hypothetical protein